MVNFKLRTRTRDACWQSTSRQFVFLGSAHVFFSKYLFDSGTAATCTQENNNDTSLTCIQLYVPMQDNLSTLQQRLQKTRVEKTLVGTGIRTLDPWPSDSVSSGIGRASSLRFFASRWSSQFPLYRWPLASGGPPWSGRQPTILTKIRIYPERVRPARVSAHGLAYKLPLRSPDWDLPMFVWLGRVKKWLHINQWPRSWRLTFQTSSGYQSNKRGTNLSVKNFARLDRIVGVA